jgi:hypothetical protein
MPSTSPPRTKNFENKIETNKDDNNEVHVERFTRRVRNLGRQAFHPAPIGRELGEFDADLADLL